MTVAARPSVKLGARPVAVIENGPPAAEVFLFFVERCAGESAQWERAERKRVRVQARIEDAELYASCSWEEQMQAQSRLISLEREVEWVWGEASRHAGLLPAMWKRLNETEQETVSVAMKQYEGSPLAVVLARIGASVLWLGPVNCDVVPF